MRKPASERHAAIKCGHIARVLPNSTARAFWRPNVGSA
jgi:hypothetical protein